MYVICRSFHIFLLCSAMASRMLTRHFLEKIRNPHRAAFYRSMTSISGDRSQKFASLESTDPMVDSEIDAPKRPNDMAITSVPLVGQDIEYRIKMGLLDDVDDVKLYVRFTEDRLYPMALARAIKKGVVGSYEKQVNFVEYLENVQTPLEDDFVKALKRGLVREWELGYGYAHEGTTPRDWYVEWLKTGEVKHF